jgi:uncharacterized protein YegP (UPF0339 family)
MQINKSNMGAFVISKRFNGQYKFVFTSRKGKTIFTSNGFDDKESCEAEIEKLRQSIPVLVFSKQKASGGRFMFRILFEDTQIAVSRKYSTELRVQKGIDEIVKSAATAEILDFSENAFVFEDEAEC